nr:MULTISPECIES: acyltransferase family protein [unclassified Gordonia (in: high G+C Gram-positive bacteria)]
MTVESPAQERSAASHARRSHVRLDLQGMRAVAVLAVVADHLFGWPRGGFVGVDVFFVLSGFFITGVLIRERSRTGKLSFRKFYVHRARRIIPSAMLVIVATVIVSYVLLTETRAKGAFIDGLWATIFLSNWRFERTGTDYFAQGQPPSPLQHYWSLSIEEQFYFVWPVLLVALFAATRRFSRRGRRYPPKRQAWIATAMGAICLASFGWACWQSFASPTAAYFSTFTRIWELGVGALLAICTPVLARIPSKIRPFLSYVGLAGVFSSLFLISADSTFPGPGAALPVLSTALVIAAFIGVKERAVPHLTNRASVYVGEVSYTLYLWHWPVIVLLAAVIPEGGPYYLTALVTTAVLTVVTFHLYENPIRRSSWLESDSRSRGRLPWRATTGWVTAGAFLGVAALMGALVVESADQRSAQSQANQELVVADVAPREDDAPSCLGAAALEVPGCPLRDPSKPLLPGIDSFADDTQGAYRCYREQGRELRNCVYGYDGPNARRIAVVGDSHAAMLLPALSPYLRENRWSMTTFVGNGCQWVIRSGGDCDKTVLPQMQDKLLSERYDLVITSASREFGDVDQYLAAWRPVASRGTKVLVVADNPAVPEETLNCLTRVSLGGSDNTGNCSTPREVALATPDPLIGAARQLPGATLLDMTASFCDQAACPAVIGDVIVYRDTNGHVSATYAKTLSPQLISSIEKALA